MVFQSIEYLLFLVSLIAMMFWLPLRGQNALLIAASYLFYGWVHHWYLILIGTTTLFDWGCGLAIDRSDDTVKRKRWLILSLGVNFSILCAFKYFGFFAENVTAALTSIGLMPAPWIIHIALPAGISFFTFQSASYAIDVYRRHAPACRSLLEYATFVSFFPQLVAGPIERAGHMLPQYRTLRRPGLHEIRSGLVLLLWGLLQKLVIADNAALLADKVFSLAAPSFPILWSGVIAFGVQIYADFSGYTDMARGSARLMGIELCSNFNDPYLAQSPADFWRRWHMSLSTWFRDYVFIPLGGSRTTASRVAINLVITFFLSGLWHGASWNFIIWGCYHGVLVALWPRLAKVVPFLGKAGGGLGIVIRITLTFVLAQIGWLMFREHSVSMLLRALTLSPAGIAESEWRMGAGMAVQAMLYGLPLMVGLPLLKRFLPLPALHEPSLKTWRWTFIQSIAAAIFLVLICALRGAVGSDFIYFQF